MMMVDEGSEGELSRADAIDKKICSAVEGREGK